MRPQTQRNTINISWLYLFIYSFIHSFIIISLIKHVSFFNYSYFSGEIGGNMGLFLGCSLMTVFEFADLLVALIFVRKLNREYQT